MQYSTECKTYRQYSQVVVIQQHASNSLTACWFVSTRLHLNAKGVYTTMLRDGERVKERLIAFCRKTSPKNVTGPTTGVLENIKNFSNIHKRGDRWHLQVPTYDLRGQETIIGFNFVFYNPSLEGGIPRKRVSDLYVNVSNSRYVPIFRYP